MREEGLAEGTQRVYVTPRDNPCRHIRGAAGDSRAFPYIRTLSSRTEATYRLVSGYIPLFCTEYRPW